MITQDQFLNKYSPMRLDPNPQGDEESGLRIFQAVEPVQTLQAALAWNDAKLVGASNALWLVRRGEDPAFRYALDGSAAGKVPSQMFLHAGLQPLMLTTRAMMEALVIQGFDGGPGFFYAIQFFAGRTGSRR